MIKKIHNVSPYNNGMFYKNCFSTSLLSIISNYSKSIPIIVNEVDFYYLDGDNILRILPIQVTERRALLSDIGFEERSKISNENK
jgi:hypothetical protein